MVQRFEYEKVLNLIYFTGHGGKGDKNSHNTTHLWDNQKVKYLIWSKVRFSRSDPVNYFNHGTMLHGITNYIFEEDPKKG